MMRICQESRCAVATQLGVESMETTTTAIVLLFASTIYFDSCPLKTNTYITTTTKKKIVEFQSISAIEFGLRHCSLNLFGSYFGPFMCLL